MSAERRTYQLTLYRVNDDETLDEALEVNETLEFQVNDVGGPHITRPEDLIMRIENAIYDFEKDLE